MYTIERQEDICIYLRKILDNSGVYHQALLIYFIAAKLLQKSEMRKDIVIELSYKGFS